ncbi:MAG: sugar nucleotide-binding protein, partial [Desulfuromonadales bacterium]|nr:sugar nucleotide-binding protein [Desulfuromonadales bacterium]
MEKAQPIIALMGASGMLARKVLEKASAAGYAVSLYDLPNFDMTDRAQVLQEMTRLQPDVIINCAAFTNVDGAETEQDLAMTVNGTAVGYLAEAA